MPDGGTLSVAACPDGLDGEREAVRIEIGDTGCGIDAADLEKIWEPFFTTKERGSGLGLAIVRRIVENHGGAVVVQSDARSGTQFSVRLPRIAPDRIEPEENVGPEETNLPMQRAAAGGAVS
jgi:two-component system sensor histidine kinase PilS (NtrC family)